jgi:MFS family permease
MNNPKTGGARATNPAVDPAADSATKIFGIQKEIFWLGIVSFLTDVSSEMLFAVLTVFMSAILGASSFIIGLMEGLSDFSASSLDYISGYLSDKTGKRKIFALFGYGFSTLAKLSLVFFNSIAGVFAFRVVERLGKSIRGAPRDALISSIADKEKMGFAFGFHKALDKSGAVLGPFIGYFILAAFGQNMQSFQLIFLVAIVPAILSVLLLGFFVHEKKLHVAKVRESVFKNYDKLGKPFHRYLKIAGCFSLAYFSYAFLLLKAYSVGFQIKDVVLLYALFNLSFTLISIPAGKIGDRIGRKSVIMAEYILYALMCVGFIFASDKIAVILLFLVYGIFYAIDEGQTKAYITDIVPGEHRASAIGLYNFITGLVYLLASLLAGWLWNAFSPAATFGAAAVIAVISAIAFSFLKPPRTAR